MKKSRRNVLLSLTFTSGRLQIISKLINQKQEIQVYKVMKVFIIKNLTMVINLKFDMRKEKIGGSEISQNCSAFPMESQPKLPIYNCIVF